MGEGIVRWMVVRGRFETLSGLLLLIRPPCSRRCRVRSPWVTLLTILILIDAIGWALGVLLTLNYVFSHRTLPTVAGIRLLMR
jgi:hypothetical protein